MSEKRYVLQAKEFAYNDEYYNFYGDGSDGKINSIFNDKELAVKAWKELERKTLKIRPLSSVGSSRVDLQACKLEYSIVSPK